MKRHRMVILYAGRVQGVGFRYTVKVLTTGYEVVGKVANLPDGRVELVAEGTREELEAFQVGVRESGLSANIRSEELRWHESTGEFRGFEIVR